MQKKLINGFLFSLALMPIIARAQENVYPSIAQKGTTAITHATVHVGNGTILNDAIVVFENGKITSVGAGAVPTGATIVDATGKQVYPGLILPSSDLGLKEVSAGVRGSNDYAEIGENNANIHAIHAYNADSKIIGVLRENGILLAGIAPEGELIQGQSSVVQLSAWNFEDAAYKIDNGLYVELPSFMVRRGARGMRAMMMGAAAEDPLKQANEKVATIKQFFDEAKAYQQEKTHVSNNLRFEAVKGLFNGSKKLFVRANEVKQMLVAIDIAKTYGFKLVLVGASEAFQIAPLLAQNKVEVILAAEHSLPTTEDDDVDQPYKTAATLQKAGVVYCLNDTHDQSRYRNLAFNAGTTVAYGVAKEDALSAITKNAAIILGIADKTGTIEVGKDANIIITQGDVLDMRGNQLSHAFIQGRNVSLDNKGKQLYDRYKFKYGIK